MENRIWIIHFADGTVGSCWETRDGAAEIAGQIIMLLPIWEMDTKLQYLTMYAATVVITFLLLLELKDKITKKKSYAAATTRLKTR